MSDSRGACGTKKEKKKKKRKQSVIKTRNGCSIKLVKTGPKDCLNRAQKCAELLLNFLSIFSSVELPNISNPAVNERKFKIWWT
jgi:hypothetical protein